MILNAGNRPLSIENIPLDDIEKTFENDDVGCSSNSQLGADAPPLKTPESLRIRAFHFSVATRFATFLFYQVSKYVLDGPRHERSTVDIFSPDGFAAPTAHRRSPHTPSYIIAWLERSYMVLMD